MIVQVFFVQRLTKILLLATTPRFIEFGLLYSILDITLEQYRDTLMGKIYEPSLPKLMEAIATEARGMKGSIVVTSSRVVLRQ